jgi:pimeloyl-ACP methyl ester carboxylesterase
VLLLNGDADKTAPFDGARAMASQLARAEPQLLTGCGHWPTIERSKQVAYAMTVFYARQRRSQDAS